MNVRVDVVFDWRNKSREDVPGAVSVRVYYSRTDRKYINTGVSVLPSQWDDRLWVVRRSDADLLNSQIQEQVDKCKDENARCEDRPSVEQMKVDKSDASFLDWLHDTINKQRIKDTTRKHHMSMYHMLMQWGKMRRFEHVTRRNILAFMDWLSRRSVMKPVDGVMVECPIEQSTVHGHWKRLRKYIRIAQSDGLIPMNATANISISAGTSKEREYLTDEELERFMNAELSTECLRMARDRFIVQCCTGLSYADLMSIDMSSHDVVDGHVVVTGTRKKTGERFFFVVLPFCLDILERWGWKVPAISNTDYNKFLLRGAEEAGIDKHITSHVGRHTYACYCLRHGVRIEAVQRTLGHAKISTTQIYARMADMDVVRAFDNIKI